MPPSPHPDSSASLPRHSTGLPGLDDLLGGGLLPGTLTVVVGATGIGKTQLGLHYANAGGSMGEGRGVVLDLSSRGDSQNHAAYAQSLFGWKFEPASPRAADDLDRYFDQLDRFGDYLHIFDRSGRPVTRRDLDPDAYREWQAELNRKLASTIAFLYGSFVAGKRRVVLDGIEPVDRPSDSIQLELCQYIYQQVCQKEADWVARDLFRQKYRAHAAEIEARRYAQSDIGCMLLYTSREVLLDELISRPLDEGDLLSGANTLIYMGKIREGRRIRRALYVGKHRGSACVDEVVPYTIDDDGLHIEKRLEA